MNIEIICPYEGIVEEIHLKMNDYIIPEQTFGIVRIKDGLSPIISQYEGKIKNIFVEKGDQVVRGMVIAIISEK